MMSCSIGTALNENCSAGGYHYLANFEPELQEIIVNRVKVQKVINSNIFELCNLHKAKFDEDYEYYQRVEYGCCNPYKIHVARVFSHLYRITPELADRDSNLTIDRQLCEECLNKLESRMPSEHPIEITSKDILAELIGKPYSYEKFQYYYCSIVSNLEGKFDLQLRPYQAEAMYHMLNGMDAVVCLRTNYGKTLPMMMSTFLSAKSNGTKPICLIIAPLQTIICEFKRRLEDWNVKGVQLTLSSIKSGMIKNTIDEEVDGTPIYLMSSPEILLTNDARDILTTANVTQVCVDEVHVAPSWGKKFRKAFSEIHEIRQFILCPIAVFTATLTIEEKKQVSSCTGLRETNLVEIADSPDRPEIFLSLQFRSDFETSFKAYAEEINMKGRNAKKTLVFVNSISRTHAYNIEFRSMLNNKGRILKEGKLIGYLSQHFSASTGTKAKQKILKDFSQEHGTCVMLFATVSYGLGLDNKFIDRVIVWDNDKVASSVWQKVSRGCRNGQKGEGIIFQSRTNSNDTLLNMSKCLRHCLLHKFIGYKTPDRISTPSVELCTNDLYSCHSYNCCDYCRKKCRCERIYENMDIDL